MGGRRGVGASYWETLICVVIFATAGCSGSGTSARATAPPTSGVASTPTGTASASSSVARSTATSASAPPSMLPIRYLVAPHPDDEFAMWSMAQDRAHFPVLLV